MSLLKLKMICMIQQKSVITPAVSLPSPKKEKESLALLYKPSMNFQQVSFR